ncbi:5-demethoxyubiquinol-8 5-hydroxylase UbiM [uncultured Pseudacidovorax sp.]|uniref:5-demethoxyubiquinol-8 5-hydroxylase UbiM n=1 Tax=uncultured Pseudacidovorax sp. TaxID=679313 RepID=UPI0025DC2FF3|nr:5-demethoxyubiquinol-8 5-hydroxylase UbiM [uncultured Pseudacidovorax sp.]
MPSIEPFDVAIVGAGPAGLTLGIALARQGHAVAVLDHQDADSLATPSDDGREIALTHASVGLLRALGIWQRLPAEAIGRIREARVTDGGPASPALRFHTAGTGCEALGAIVANHAIRRACFETAASQARLRLLPGHRVETVRITQDHAHLTRHGADPLHARLLVAADSRFSSLRRQLGVRAALQDFGRTMVVCRVAHEAADHGDVAHECFGPERTLAMLPLPGRFSSAVLTVSSAQAPRLCALPPAEFAQEVQRQFGDGLGPLRLAGERHAYPLVATYAERFAGHRFALAGDAAVGMHPVTAHGFNLGLQGVRSLCTALAQRPVVADPGDADRLRHYERLHRRETAPIYHGTNAVARLYAGDSGPQRLLRRLVLDAARRVPPVRAAITRQLTGAGPTHF